MVSANFKVKMVERKYARINVDIFIENAYLIGESVAVFLFRFSHGGGALSQTVSIFDYRSEVIDALGQIINPKNSLDVCKKYKVRTIAAALPHIAIAPDDLDLIRGKKLKNIVRKGSELTQCDQDYICDKFNTTAYIEIVEVKKAVKIYYIKLVSLEVSIAPEFLLSGNYYLGSGSKKNADKSVKKNDSLWLWKQIYSREERVEMMLLSLTGKKRGFVIDNRVLNKNKSHLIVIENKVYYKMR